MKLSTGGKFFSQNKTSFADTDAGFYMDTTGDFHAGDSASFIKFDASAGTVAIKADTIQFSSGTNVSTFDGAYGSLSGTPTFGDLTINGTTFSPTGSNVSISSSGLGIDTTYIEDELGVSDIVGFGNTNISGGRITLTGTTMNLNKQSSGGPQTLSSGGIELNAFTQQIIISDGS